MNNLTSTNLNTKMQNINPQLQQRMQNQDNYTALDKEQIKTDTVEIANKTKDNMQENFMFRFLRNLGSDNPKRILSTIFAVLSVAGLAVAGNKLSDPSAKLGQRIDDILLDNSNALGKVYGNLSSFFAKVTSNIKDGLKKIPGVKNLTSDIQDTMKNRKLGMEVNFFRGYDRGPVGIFINTLTDIFDKTTFAARKTDLLPIQNALGVTNAKESSKISYLLKEAQDKLNSAATQQDKQKFASIITQIQNIQAQDNVRLDSFKKLFGDVKAQEIFDNLAAGVDSSSGKQFYTQLTEALVDNIKTKCPQLVDKSTSEILILAKKNEIPGMDFSEFLGVKMGGTLLPNPVSAVKGIPGAIARIPGVALNTIFHPFQTLGNVMTAGGNLFSKVAGDWWPVNLIESVGRKIPGNENFTFGRANLFDSLIKFNAMNGTGAKTLPGKIVQKTPTLITECISNFVNDKSGFGVFLALNLIDSFDTIQDAPDDKKLSTAANDASNQVLTWMLSMPIAYKIIYGLGSMKNLQGKGIGSKLLRVPGHIFGLGLGQKNGVWGKIAGVAGGAFRFYLFTQVFQPRISKMINFVSNKLFGKPYNPQEEAKAKALEAQQNQIIPELGISQAQLMQKIQTNPKAIENLQNNPQVLQQLKTNPKLLVDYLDGKDITKISQTPQAANPQSTSSQTTSSKKPISPLTQQMINRQKANSQTQPPQHNPQPRSSLANNNAQLSNSQAANSQANNSLNSVDSATYIPSSAFIAGNSSTLSPDKSAQYNERMVAADKALKRAEKFI